MDGIYVERKANYAVCHIEYFSDELKNLIRKNLSSICHGAFVVGKSQSMYSYKATLGSFVERYEKKPEKTKIGMIGEFLSHILIADLFDGFSISSALFNLEENSIKKGFDLILYESESKDVWITEVKSGCLHENKDHDETTTVLLNKAKADLKKRLDEQKIRYWTNAINSVRCAIADSSDYKDILVSILEDNGNAAAEKKASASNKSVVLISNLFDNFNKKVSTTPAEKVIKAINKKKVFKNVMVLSIHKNTYHKIYDFIKSEV